MRPLSLLIVEDDVGVLEYLSRTYAAVFRGLGYDSTIQTATTVADARGLAKFAERRPYDLVSLDVNLGDTSLTGLDVLQTLGRFHSAWMVALLTGVESDPTLDATVGGAKGSLLRSQLRRDAYARFPADRLLVVEKPSASLAPDAAHTLLANRLRQIALVYEEVGRLRYVFRPIEVKGLQRVKAPKGAGARRAFVQATALQWQIRFNCGEIRTLPDMAGFRTLHYLLSRDRGHSVTPEQAIASEPKTEAPKDRRNEQAYDPIAEYFQAQGIAWKALPTDEQDRMIRAALSLKIRSYVELREYEEDGDIAPSERDTLERIVAELGPLAEAAENVYQTRRASEVEEPEGIGEHDTAALAQEGLRLGRGDYDQHGKDRRGMDSPAAQLFRARMKRVKDCLRENGFADFASHIEAFVQSTGASWSYSPPEGVEWTT